MHLPHGSMRLTAGVGLVLASMNQQHGAVQAHSWIDCLDTDYDKIYTQSASYIYGGSGGNGFCDGYGAGYPGRGDEDIGTDYTFKMLENYVEAGTDVCQTVDADTYTNTDWRTMLSVAAGETVYFSYLPNGHVVKDKKAVGTQHGIYWTGDTDTELTSTLEMTADNLLNGYTLDFDDGNCGETVDNNGDPSGRAGDGKPCIGSFVIPTGTAPGTYSFVWYWTFWLDNASSYVDQSQASGYFGAAYSTCFQVEVTSSGSNTSSEAEESTTTTATDAPEATTATPAATTEAPVATTEAPVATTEAPVTTTEAPVATTEAPVVVTDASVATTEAPAATTAAPVATTEAPAATTAAPVATTEAPAATTAAPVATTEAPVATTAAPVATTEAPVATTAAPVATTEAPVTVTEAPVATTPTPVATTEAPTATTASSASTTEERSAITTNSSDSASDSEEDDDGYRSYDVTTTFSALDDDDAESVGTVHASSESMGGSTSSSGSAEVEVGSASVATEIESTSTPSTTAPETSSSSTASASESSAASDETGSQSATTQDSSAVSVSGVRRWLALACALLVGALL